MELPVLREFSIMDGGQLKIKLSTIVLQLSTTASKNRDKNVKEFKTS